MQLTSFLKSKVHHQ